MKVLAAGILLTAVVAALLVRWLGAGALLPTVVMGGVATAIELVAVRALRRAPLSRGTAEFFKAVGVGMALRLLGVVVFAGLVLWDRGRFLPLATGLGYVGVLIPLLFLEVRFLR